MSRRRHDGSRGPGQKAQCRAFFSQPGARSRRESALAESPVTSALTRFKVLDATLKEITSALLESDVNVKLVQSLRQKVKAKVKASLEASAADKSKETNRKNLIQKVN